MKERPRVLAREQVSAIRCPASPQGRRTQAQQNTSSTAKKRCPPPRRVGIMPRAAQILDSFGLRHPGVRPPQRIWLPAGSNTFPKSPDSDQPPGAKLSAPRRGLNPEPDTVVCSAWSPKPQGVKFPRLYCTPELIPNGRWFSWEGAVSCNYQRLPQHLGGSPCDDVSSRFICT